MDIEFDQSSRSNNKVQEFWKIVTWKYISILKNSSSQNLLIRYASREKKVMSKIKNYPFHHFTKDMICIQWFFRS